MSQRVSADAARQHLLRLQRVGVGLQRAARLSRVSFRTLQRIRRSTPGGLRIQLETEQKVLAVRRPSLAKGQRVNGYRTRVLLHALLSEGYQKQQLARCLGLRSRALRLNHATVTVKNALKVQALHAALLGDADEGPVQPAA